MFLLALIIMEKLLISLTPLTVTVLFLPKELEACLVARDVDADTSKKRIIDKREMKAVLGRSPDYFDPLMMRMYYEIVPQPKGMRVHVGRLS